MDSQIEIWIVRQKYGQVDKYMDRYIDRNMDIQNRQKQG